MAMTLTGCKPGASSNPEYVESSAETLTERKQLLQSIEKEIQMLPARQREAFPFALGGA